LKILSNMPAVPRWQEVKPGMKQPAFRSDHVFQIDLGNPLSVLPNRVQESLRAGLPVDQKDIVPVPTL
jgi:hypothetical protein